MELPEFYAITPPLRSADDGVPFLDQEACQAWLKRFERLLRSGVSMVQIRAKELGPENLRTLVAACADVAQDSGLRLLLNGPANLAADRGLAGIHLTSQRLRSLSVRPVPQSMLLGASCHSPDELEMAERIDADFACLSPVKPVSGYGQRSALGFERFGQWARACSIPVYALGGLKRQDLGRVLESGGQGVAGISAFW